MGLLQAIAERRVTAPTEQRAFPQMDAQFWEMLWGNESTWTGRTVTQENALSVSGYWAGIKLISETIGTLPLKLYRETEAGKAALYGDPRHRMLNVQANTEMTAATLRTTLESHRLMWGNAFAEKVYNGRGEVVELWPLLPDRTWKEYRKNGEVYFVTQIDAKQIRLPADRVLYIPGFGYDGRQGYSLLHVMRQTLGLSQASEETAAKFYGNGMRPSGVLIHPNRLNDQARANLRKSIETQTGGLTNSQRLLILEEGFQYEQIGLPPGDSQFLESREFQIEEIARFLNVPLHKLKVMKHAPDRTVEQAGIEFVQETITPIAVNWEQALAKDLLRQAERDVYFKLDVRGLLRGDSQARSTYYRELFNSAALTPNEIRALEDMAPVDGGDQLFINSTYLPVEMAGQDAMALDGQARATPVDSPATPAAPAPLAPVHAGASTAFRYLYEDYFARLGANEARRLKRAGPDAVESFYTTDFEDAATDLLRPLFDALGRSDLASVVRQYAVDARRELGDVPESVWKEKLDGWSDRASRWAVKVLA